MLSAPSLATVRVPTTRQHPRTDKVSATETSMTRETATHEPTYVQSYAKMPSAISFGYRRPAGAFGGADVLCKGGGGG